MSLDRALHEFRDLVQVAEIDLAGAALAVARLEYPDLAPERSLAHPRQRSHHEPAVDVAPFSQSSGDGRSSGLTKNLALGFPGGLIRL